MLISSLQMDNMLESNIIVAVCVYVHLLLHDPSFFKLIIVNGREIRTPSKIILKILTFHFIYLVV